MRPNPIVRAEKSPTAERLLAGLSGVNGSGTREPGEAAPMTYVLGPDDGPEAVEALSGPLSERRAARMLVLSWVGTHPDATAPALRRSWRLEESCRASKLPTLTLRIAPMLGPRSPLWLRLGRASRLGARGRKLLTPVLESDVVETIRRALRVGTEWGGWCEVAGREVLSLAELAEMARGAGSRGAGAWEPGIDVLAEQRLCEVDAWVARFGFEPEPVTRAVARWVA